jgi:hypothetical protein
MAILELNITLKIPGYSLKISSEVNFNRKSILFYFLVIFIQQSLPFKKGCLQRPNSWTSFPSWTISSEVNFNRKSILFYFLVIFIQQSLPFKKGCLQRPNSWTSFPSCYWQSRLQLCTAISISSNSGNLLQLLERVTLQRKKKENLIENHTPSLWFKKSIQKPQVWELYRLCPKTSKKLVVHEFGFNFRRWKICPVSQFVEVVI